MMGGAPQGRSMNSLWLVITALAAFLVAYRFYGAFLAAKVAVLNDRRVTPAHRLRDDVDYHPTRRLVLFGVHFAAIAGSGPLVGPVLASQLGYFPGFCWIVIGACLAGGVHDFVVLLASVRHDGKSLPRIARELARAGRGSRHHRGDAVHHHRHAGGDGKVVVNALNESAWGMFTIVVTIPAALLTGFWMNKIRPGRIGEASLIGVTLVVAGVIFGQRFDDSAYRGCLLFSIAPIGGDAADLRGHGVDPAGVGVAMSARLSQFLHEGRRDRAAGRRHLGGASDAENARDHAVHPRRRAGRRGTVWPFVCIVITCGALSGFHALIASGTTPKMINKESDIRPIGYGAMILEGFVSLTALIAACSLEPGDYFKINTEPAQYEQFVKNTRQRYGWDLRPRELSRLKEEAGVKEDLTGRTAGAVTLAVGMAKVLGDLPGMRALMAYLYHFVIMFEALFILTLLETGTRVARFILQDTVAVIWRASGRSHAASWATNVIASVVVCGLWGYLLYNFEIAPCG